MASEKPFISVITPVYNGAAYLQECIQSVLAQSFENFEYLIVDNCSIDESRNIAEKAARTDGRISVIRCDKHLGPIQNWNRSLQSVDQNSDYIKFVHADDWIFPDCLARMIEVAENDEKIGLVSAYRLEQDRVSLDILPSNAPLVPGEDTFTMDGRDVVRAILKDKASVIGSPTAVMIRSSLIPSGGQLFSTDYLHADKDACLRILQSSNFGFVTQVLTFTRRHNESVTSMTNSLDTRRQENLLFLKKYGPAMLSEEEYQDAVSQQLRAYYDFLARKVGTGSGHEFWTSHRDNLQAARSPFSRLKLIVAVLRRWMNPASALKDCIQDRSCPKNKVGKNTLRLLAVRRQVRDENE